MCGWLKPHSGCLASNQFLLSNPIPAIRDSEVRLSCHARRLPLWWVKRHIKFYRPAQFCKSTLLFRHAGFFDYLLAVTRNLHHRLWLFWPFKFVCASHLRRLGFLWPLNFTTWPALFLFHFSCWKTPPASAPNHYLPPWHSSNAARFSQNVYRYPLGFCHQKQYGVYSCSHVARRSISQNTLTMLYYWGPG